MGCVVSGASRLLDRALHQARAMKWLLNSVGDVCDMIVDKAHEEMMRLLFDILSPWLSLLWESFKWEKTVIPLVLSFLLGLWLLLNLVFCIRSRLYCRRERKLAQTLAFLMEERCHLLDRLYMAQEEYRALNVTLEQAKQERKSFRLPELTETYENLLTANSMAVMEIRSLTKQLKAQRVRLDATKLPTSRHEQHRATGSSSTPSRRRRPRRRPRRRARS